MKEYIWRSQPKMPGTQISAGNFLLNMATLLAGSLPGHYWGGGGCRSMHPRSDFSCWSKHAQDVLSSAIFAACGKGARKRKLDGEIRNQ